MPPSPSCVSWPATLRKLAEKGGPAHAPELIPLSVPEMRHLTLALAADAARRAFLLRWSHWRRAHQAGAKRCHTTRHARERAIPPPPPIILTLPQGELTDAEWTRVQPLLPPQKPVTRRPRHDHRRVLSGILWVLRTASPWREMPAQLGKWETAYARYRLWCKQGVWQRIIDALGPTPELPSPSARAPDG